jgi:hypothetical protein
MLPRSVAGLVVVARRAPERMAFPSIDPNVDSEEVYPQTSIIIGRGSLWSAGFS